MQSTLLRALMAAVLLAVCAAVSGCAGQRPFSGLFGSDDAAGRSQQHHDEPTAPAVYYAGVEGLKLYAEPRLSSSVVSRLALHQKLYRHELDRGFARVTVDGSGQAGWVDNAQLVWRLPRRPAERPSARENGGAPPAPPEAAEPAPPPAAAPAAAPVEPAPRAPDSGTPDLFDAY